MAHETCDSSCTDESHEKPVDDLGIHEWTPEAQRSVIRRAEEEAKPDPDALTPAEEKKLDAIIAQPPPAAQGPPSPVPVASAAPASRSPHITISPGYQGDLGKFTK